MRLDRLSGESARKSASLALAGLHREYPNKIAHVLNGDADVRPPRDLTPAFYGCYDWHSAVHGHWMLARLLRVLPRAPFAAEARAALARSLTEANLATEAAYVGAKNRESFERPYGLAWLLTLALELAEWNDPDALRFGRSLRLLVDVAADRLRRWLPRLTHPVRSGEHSQTAFALGLILDWARGTGVPEMAGLVADRARSFFLGDRGVPLSYEPSGEDFLSPCLAEADLMRRVLEPGAFAAWLGEFLPGLGGGAKGAGVAPVVPADRSDPKLVHLDGLNLSRAWMLEGIASRLADGDPRRQVLAAAAREHEVAGLAGVSSEHYVGSHWLGTFAVYLLTERGLR